MNSSSIPNVSDMAAPLGLRRGRGEGAAVGGIAASRGRKEEEGGDVPPSPRPRLCFGLRKQVAAFLLNASLP